MEMAWDGMEFREVFWPVPYLARAGRQRILMFPPDNSWSTVESDGVLVESADQVLPPYTHLLQSLESEVSQ